MNPDDIINPVNVSTELHRVNVMLSRIIDALGIPESALAAAPDAPVPTPVITTATPAESIPDNPRRMSLQEMYNHYTRNEPLLRIPTPVTDEMTYISEWDADIVRRTWGQLNRNSDIFRPDLAAAPAQILDAQQLNSEEAAALGEAIAELLRQKMAKPEPAVGAVEKPKPTPTTWQPGKKRVILK